MKHLEIAISGDSNYLVPLTVLLKSIFINHTDAIITVNFLHLYSSISLAETEQLSAFVSQHGHQLRKLGVTDEQLGEVPESRHSKNTFLRLLLPTLLPPEVKKVLYLDGDIVVNGSLWDLYSLDISNVYIAGANDPVNVFGREHCKNLGIPEGKLYFNAGVVLMNIERMRRENLQSRFFSFIREHMDHLQNNDQDVLNGTLYEAVKLIPPTYNYNFWLEKDIALQLFTPEEIKAAQRTPVIVHYIGPVKPWQYKSLHPKRSLWWRYLKQTPYSDFKPVGKTFGAVCTRCIQQLFISPVKSALTVKNKQRLGRLLPESLKMKLKRVLGKAQ